MWKDIFNLAINNGLWAVLFLILLFYVLKDSRAREKKYQDTIDKLGKSVAAIEEIKSDVREIKDKIEHPKSKKSSAKEKNNEKI